MVLRRAVRPLVGLLLALGHTALAQTPAGPLDPAAPAAPAPPGPPGPPAPAGITGWVEAGANFHELATTEPDWFGQYVRGVVDVEHRDVWSFEVVNQARHGDEGVFFSVGNTHVFDPDWYTAVSLGTSAGGVFWPRFRADAFVNRKWLADRQLITTLGAGYYDAKDEHYDVSGYVGFAYYFPAPWIVEGGLRYNVSYPGAVTAPSPFIAVTYGREKAYYLTARFGFGREAYQIIGPDEVIVDFPSQVFTLTWRHWLTREWGFRVSAEHYNNPFYERNGIELGVFRDF